MTLLIVMESSIFIKLNAKSEIAADLEIKILSADHSSDEFIAYLPKPEWFKVALQPAFDDHRKKTKGEIYLVMQGNQKVCGCVYLELTPVHRSYGKSVPVFGWLYAESEGIARLLLTTCEMKTRNSGGSQLRGPISSPKTFGGWGCLVPNTNEHPEIYPNPRSVECADNSPEILDWIENAGFVCDAEYQNMYNTSLLEVSDFPGFLPHLVQQAQQ